MTTYEIIKKTHFVVVTLFFLLYFVKTILLLANKKDQLQSLTKKTKVIEMILSFLFLGTGIWLMFQIAEIKMLLIIKISLVFLSIPLAIIGFKKSNKVLALLSFLMLTAAFGLAEMSAKRNEAKAGANSEELYVNNCGTCHGKDGKLGLSGASDLTATQLSADSITSVILNGRNMMPKTNLSPEQARDIATYVGQKIKGKQ
jgi:cytochrome c553